MFTRSSGLSSITVLLCGLNAACSTYGVPSLNHGVLMRTPPQVVDLVNHVNCEIAQAMLKQPKDSLWHYLWDENFVASVDFTLLATNTEGFNPSINWMVPTSILNKQVAFPVPNPPGTPGSGSMFNRGLAVGIQANGTQDRNFDVTYNIDMSRLHTAVRRTALEASLGTPPTEPDLTSICGAEKNPAGSASKKLKATYSGLQGELGLQDTINWGLDAINAGRVYGVYGNSGPVTRGDENIASPAPKAGTPAEQHLETLNAFIASGGGTPAGKQGSGAQTGGTTFSSKIDFTIVEGVNGGPSWTLLKWKIGGGAGGAGGGGAGGAGGAGGGGAGGGGGGQMLNWNRTVMDSMVITLAPTCSSVVEGLDDSTVAASTPAETLQWEVHDTLYTVDQPDWPTKAGSLPGPRSGAASPKIRVAKQVDHKTVRTVEFGTIQWNGYAYPAADDAKKETQEAGRIELRGLITDPITGNPVGVITLYRDQGRAAYGNVTQGLYERLSDVEQTPDYWTSLQSCELVTPTQKQGLMDRGQETNNLFKLNNTQRQRLLQ
jgi:hypothetical protein